MSVIILNSQNFSKEAEKSGIPVIVDFYADWCGPCQMMKPIFEELSDSYKGKLKFAKINTDENDEIAGRYSIEGIPCLILMKKGKEIGRIIGFVGKDQLKQKIDKIIR